MVAVGKASEAQTKLVEANPFTRRDYELTLRRISKNLKRPDVMCRVAFIKPPDTLSLDDEQTQAACLCYGEVLGYEMEKGMRDDSITYCPVSHMFQMTYRDAHILTYEAGK